MHFKYFFLWHHHGRKDEERRVNTKEVKTGEVQKEKIVGKLEEVLCRRQRRHMWSAPVVARHGIIIVSGMFLVQVFQSCQRAL